MGRAEAALWRAYYERRRLDLVVGIILSDHRHFGSSPWDSVRSGFAAARAAWRFQASRSRPEAMTTLPSLTHHFAVVARATDAWFDPAQAAHLELASYAPAIAAATGYVYGLDPMELADQAQLRAAAMHDHDIQGEAMTEADWRRMADRLTASYTALRGAIRISALTTVGGSAEPRPEVSP